jgi:hypothetical protein
MLVPRFTLKGLDSYDLPDGRSLPPDPANCSININASIGEEDREGADLSSFTFVTPAWLASNSDRWTTLRHTLVVHEFSWELAEEALSELIDSIEASNWEGLAEKFGRYGAWEFEGIPRG